jgi:hypothetical protein
MTLPSPVVMSKAQLLYFLQGGDPQTLLLRNLIETLFTYGVDRITTIEEVIGTGGAAVQSLSRSTTTALEDVADDINTAGKFEGKAVINTTTGAIVTADGPLAADVWLGLDGTTDHTPV